MACFTIVLTTVSLLLATGSAAPYAEYGITIPEKCGLGFCSVRPEGYDMIERQINSLLPPNLLGFDDRYGFPEEPVSDNDDNCPSRTTWESAYAYVDPKQQTKMDIIVQTKLFPQRFAQVHCVNTENDSNTEGAQCFTGLALNRFNKKITCEETMATRTLLVYDPEAYEIKRKNYTISVCCSCQIRTV